HRRFLSLFGKIVLKVDTESLPDADPAALREIVGREAGREVPTDPGEQLRLAIAAAFASSDSRRARPSRRPYHPPADLGTAVTAPKGVLYLLQTRSAKRAPEAAVRIAVEMVDEGILTPAEAPGRVTAEQVRMLLRPHLAPSAAKEADVLAQGEPACPGVGRGVC